MRPAGYALLMFDGIAHQPDSREIRAVHRPSLPTPRGPLSQWLIETISGASPGHPPAAQGSDPYGDDLQLALYVAYELHYRGFDGVDDDMEWDPAVLTQRAELERLFIGAIRRDAGDVDVSVVDEMDGLCVESPHGDGLSYELRDGGSWDRFRDYFAMRSLYQLKEADPHAWAIPRLQRDAKAAFVAVEFDEFGAGRGHAVHQELFADLLVAADLDPRYLAYLDTAPAWALAPVNLMSCFGLHRALRGAAVGHLAATEITSPTASARILAGLESLDAPEACRHFYREHVEADAVHEQVLRTDVVGALIAAEPELELDVVLGIRGFLLTENMWEDGIRRAWETGPIVTPTGR